MGVVNNIKIIVEDRYELDFESPESLGIKFNRTVEDFTDLSKRFGEYSYTFSLPQTKVNVEAFEYAQVKGRKGIFVGTQKTCRVYNNSKLLLDGVIELRAVKSTTFDCAFFSKFTQLIDDIGDKKLTDISDDVIGVWNNFTYEPDIVSHLNQNYADSDYTAVQFPLIYYSTPWTPYSVLNGAHNDFQGTPFIADRYLQNYYYLFGDDSNTTTNEWYFHQFPLAIYINRVLEGVLNDAGWSLGGSFFERPEIKKIVMLYVGDNDVYDKAIGCPDDMLDQCTGVTNNLVIKTFLPDMSQTEFIKGLMNTFNLYFTIDIDNKIIKFETWNTLFSDNYNPYDITNKIFSDSINFSRIDNYDPSISFADSGNGRVMGDNLVMVTNSTTPPASNTYEAIDESYEREVFNRIGTTSEISIPFGLPQVGRHYLRQDINDSGNAVGSGGSDFQIWLPNLTQQTPNDNDNKPFYKDTGDTFLNNTEDTIAHKGKPTLMYYYGQSQSDIETISGTDNYRMYWIGLGTTPTRVKFGIANPFTLLQGNALTTLNNYLADSPVAKSKDTAEANNLKGLHYMLGKQAGNVANVPPYSLTFGEDDTFNETLWTTFHKEKYDLYANSELLEATMTMNDVDWNEMQINRPILYNDEIYSIISIDNYDVVNRTASIKLIKR